MTTTSYRSRSAVGVRHLFPLRHYFCCTVASWCTRNDDNDILPQTLSGECSSLFSAEGLLCCPVASFSGNDDDDILPLTLGGGCCQSGFAIRSRCPMTTTFPRRAGRSAVGVRHFFRRGTTLLSGRVLVHAER
ncbi:hypothetical protein TNCV_2440151 [Trichonephila clavipes]|nr:hypothetical protein TNCV_2440151 [Trichonephila clavipes]